MADPWLSVIIPSHHGERWLTATLQSLIEQRNPGLEIIFIDSSANTESLDIARNFSQSLNTRLFSRPDLGSWMAKTNYGAAVAQADWVCILHQDDLWLPNRCQEIQKWISLQPDAVMYLHPCYFIDESGKRLGLWRCPLPSGEVPVPKQLLLKRLLVQNFIGIPAPVIRRLDFLAAGGLDDHLWYTADWDLYLKLTERGSIYYHREPLACFRVHKNSLTVLGSRNRPDFVNQHEIIIARHLIKLASADRDRVLRLFQVSTGINVGLAAAINHNFSLLMPALCRLLALGPYEMREFFLSSRITDRLSARLRALIRGRF